MATPIVPFGALTIKDFPDGFVFGNSTSSFQIEGATKEGGRGQSLWDVFAAERDLYGSYNGDEAVNHYEKYAEDFKILANMGVKAYRFSISWCRIVPSGKVNQGKGVNPQGIDFYNRIIDELLKNKIEPYATLLHFDSPQELENAYLGFLSPDIAKDFGEYADVCFKSFGDRVKHWMTINEPWSVCYCGYGAGTIAPGRGGLPPGRAIFPEILPPAPYTTPRAFEFRRKHVKEGAGDPATEPYIVAHHQLLAHAVAVRLYKRTYQRSQGGKIGIVLNSPWYEAYDPNSPNDKAAAERAIDFVFGWFFDPLTKGDWPATMKKNVGARLPVISPPESALIKGTFDFLGLNYYTANYVKDAPSIKPTNIFTDPMVLYETKRNGVLIGDPSPTGWIFKYPKGLVYILQYIKEKYDDPIIYITENGFDESNDSSLSLWESLYDYKRISYVHDHLQCLSQAISEKTVSQVKGYFLWSMIDNFEWGFGFTSRFGANFINFNEAERYPKLSAMWIKFFLQAPQIK